MPNVIKIDRYNFELYRFKVGAFFLRHSVCANFGIRHAAGFSSEADVENFFRDRQKLEFALGAVVFNEESLDGDNVRSGTTITYKIRLRAEQSAAESGDIGWQTSHMFPRTASVGPREDVYGGRMPGW